MARPPIPDTVQLEIKSWRAAGKTIDAIEAAMLEAREAGVVNTQMPGRGSIAKYSKEYDDLPQKKKNLDAPFEWHRLDKCDLPWEASKFLLDMWVDYQTINGMLQKEYEQPPAAPVSVRLAQWWWRVHQAVPDGVANLDIDIWAKEFVRLELYEDVLGKPQDMSGLWAYLAYRPWENADALEIYTHAWTGGGIQYLPDGWDTSGLGGQLQRIDKYAAVSLSSLDTFHPENLPSKTFWDGWARFKQMREASRAELRELSQELEQLKQTEHEEKEE